MSSFYVFFLAEVVFLYLCNFNISENVNIFGIAFWQKFKYLQIFQFWRSSECHFQIIFLVNFTIIVFYQKNDQ